jgi:transcription-repair coupling factor (superfamily II helicase)
MSLVGIRDMSIIETPPKDRLSIQTNVVKFDAHVIERAVRNELARGGQIYFVHNRVESIFSIGNLLQRLCPRRGSSSAMDKWEKTSSSGRCSAS